jgi:hypothetical protein
VAEALAGLRTRRRQLGRQREEEEERRERERRAAAAQQRQPGAPSAESAEAEYERLVGEKAALKQRLRAFDTAFAEQHGRQPSKQEKEHLRPQYQRYHDLKALIDAADERRKKQGAAEAAGAGVSGLAAATAVAAAVAGGKATAAVAAAGPASDLASIRAEKRSLQHFLRDYEKTFERQNGRKVKYVKDIAPVLDKYQQYKRLKAELARLDPAAAGGDKDDVGF